MRIELPYPPADNRLNRSGPYGRYASAQYRDWLDICSELLADELGADHSPDTDNWWLVRLEYYMPAMGDMTNRQKAILDLLGGSAVGKTKEDKGKIIQSGRGLYLNDRRNVVVTQVWVEIGTPKADACVVVTADVSPSGGPAQYVKPKKVKALSGGA